MPPPIEDAAEDAAERAAAPAAPAGPSAAIRIEPIPAFKDNYIWYLERGALSAVVDPGDAAPVERVLAQRGRTLDTIVVTHHHMDHVGGVDALVRRHGARVIGP